MRDYFQKKMLKHILLIFFLIRCPRCPFALNYLPLSILSFSFMCSYLLYPYNLQAELRRTNDLAEIHEKCGSMVCLPGMRFHWQLVYKVFNSTLATFGMVICNKLVPYGTNTALHLQLVSLHPFIFGGSLNVKKCSTAHFN